MSWKQAMEALMEGVDNEVLVAETTSVIATINWSRYELVPGWHGAAIKCDTCAHMFGGEEYRLDNIVDEITSHETKNHQP